MDKDFARDINFTNKQGETERMMERNRRLIDYMSQLNTSGLILDVGERNYLTEILEELWGVGIDSTIGDLDEVLITTMKEYDLIICSHVLEHLFNPLFCLENLRRALKNNGRLVIAMPRRAHRGKIGGRIYNLFIKWGMGHFHEMDDYSLEKLINRAGFEIERWEKFSTSHFGLGLRPFVRSFFNEQNYIECRKKVY